MSSFPLSQNFSPEEIVQQFRAIAAQIPVPDPVPTAATLRRRLAHVDANFVQASVNAAGASEAVQVALGRSDEDLRQEIDASTRWSAVTDELRMLLKRMLIANAVRRQRIGLAALQTYKICQQLVRDESHSRLEAHVSEMKRLNKFGRVRRKAAEPQPVPPQTQL